MSDEATKIANLRVSVLKHMDGALEADFNTAVLRAGMLWCAILDPTSIAVASSEVQPTHDTFGCNLICRR